MFMIGQVAIYSGSHGEVASDGGVIGVTQQGQHDTGGRRTDVCGSSQHRQAGHIFPPLCSSSANKFTNSTDMTSF